MNITDYSNNKRGQKTITVVLLVLLCLVCLSNTLFAAEVKVRFKWIAKVSDRQYFLADVARIEADEESKKRLQKIKIGYSPLPGNETTISASLIKRLVYARLPHLRNRIDWKGADEINVRAEGQLYDGERVVKLASKFLTRELQKRFEKVTLQAATSLDHYKFPKGSLVFATSADNLDRPRRRMRVLVKVYKYDDPIATIPVWFEVSATANVLVARHRVKGRKRISRRDFVVKKVDITRHAGMRATRNNEFSGRWVRKTMQRGQVLRQHHVMKQPDVVRGKPVNVKVMVKGLEITLSGVARRDASKGQQVPVVNQRSGKVFMATVTGRNTVRVAGEK